MPDKQNQQRDTLRDIEKSCPTQWKWRKSGKLAILVLTGAQYPDGTPVNVYITPSDNTHRYVASDQGEALMHANSVSHRKRIQPPHMVLQPLSLTMRYGAIIGGIRNNEEIPAVCTKVTQAAIRIVEANQA